MRRELRKAIESCMAVIIDYERPLLWRFDYSDSVTVKYKRYTKEVSEEIPAMLYAGICYSAGVHIQDINSDLQIQHSEMLIECYADLIQKVYFQEPRLQGQKRVRTNLNLIITNMKWNYDIDLTKIIENEIF